MIRFIIPYPKTPKGKSQWNKAYGLNAIYAGKHWASRKKDSEYWHMLVRSELRRQGIKQKLIDKPVSIKFLHNTKMDIDNHAYIEKMIVDSLKGYLLHDDNKKYYIAKSSEFHNEDYIGVEIAW